MIPRIIIQTTVKKSCGKTSADKTVRLINPSN